MQNDFAEAGAVHAYVAATGGNTITTVCTNYKVHTFTSPGTFTVYVAVGNSAGSQMQVSYMVVAGGGGCRHMIVLVVEEQEDLEKVEPPQCNSWTASVL